MKVLLSAPRVDLSSECVLGEAAGASEKVQHPRPLILGRAPARLRQDGAVCARAGTWRVQARGEMCILLPCFVTGLYVSVQTPMFHLSS